MLTPISPTRTEIGKIS